MSNPFHRKELITIYRQEILKDLRLFTSPPIVVADLVDYLNNNFLIAHYRGFDISIPLFSYWTFGRFLKDLGHDLLSPVMESQVLVLAAKSIIDTSFIGLDSTSVAANTSQNNPESFLSNKFKPDNQPNANIDCKLGIQTAPNQTDEKKRQFYWDYKNHVLVDCISGLRFMKSLQQLVFMILRLRLAFLPMPTLFFRSQNVKMTVDKYSVLRYKWF